MDYLPIFIAVKDAPAIVVGGGQVAHRKVEWLLAAHARVTVVAPQLGAELAELVARGAVQHVAQCFAPEQLREAALAIAATDAPAVNAAVAQAARAARVPINVVDNPELSSFIFPAIIDRSPVIVAVGSGGRSPVLVRRVRAQIEALLPAKLGALARFMGERRAAVKLALAPHGRRTFWERIIRRRGGLCRCWPATKRAPMRRLPPSFPARQSAPRWARSTSSARGPEIRIC